MKEAHYRLSGDEANGYRFKAKGSNSKNLAHGRVYPTKKAAVRAVRACRAIKIIVDIDGKTIIP